MHTLATLWLLALAQSPTLLHPARHASPSGAYVLAVDPSHRLGEGPARCRVTLGEKIEMWEDELPYAFWEAVVDDLGSSGGYAYTAGRRFPGRIVIALVSAHGEVVLEESIEHSTSLGCIGGPRSTFVHELHHHPDLGRMIVRLRRDDDVSEGEQWWIYDLAAGRSVAKLDVRDVQYAQRLSGQPTVPEDAHRGLQCLALRAVPGTPLTLCHWLRRGADGESVGAVFVLCDEGLRPVWSLALPDDYTHARSSEEFRRTDLARTGALVRGGDGPGRFEITSVASAERITLEANRDSSSATGWSVWEVGRADADLGPVVARAPDAAPLVELEEIARVPIRAGPLAIEHPIRDVGALDVALDGTVRLLRGPISAGTGTSVEVDATGNVIRELALPTLPYVAYARFLWCGLADGAWLAARSAWNESPVTALWRVDAHGKEQFLGVHVGVSVVELAAMPDGGVAGIAWLGGTADAPRAVFRWDREGAELWARVVERDAASEIAHDDPADIAAMPDGTIVVLDGAGQTLRVLDEHGASLRTIPLAEHWATPPELVTNVVALGESAVLVRDAATPVAWRRAAIRGGAPGDPVALVLDDGKAMRSDDELVTVGRDGRVWSSDGALLKQFDLAGTLLATLGPARDPERLREPSALISDARGRIAIHDARSKVVHVFDSTGAPLFRCEPDPWDFRHETSVALLPGGSDSILLELEDLDDVYVELGATGERITRRALGGRGARFVPGTEERWAIRERGWSEMAVERFGSRGDSLAYVARRADGRWFEQIRCIGVARSGAVAVLDDGESRATDACQLSLHDADGHPERTIELPSSVSYASRIECGERWISVHAHGREVVLVDVASGDVLACRTPSASKRSSCWSIGLSPDETELWALESDPPTLHRLALPR